MNKLRYGTISGLFLCPAKSALLVLMLIAIPSLLLGQKSKHDFLMQAPKIVVRDSAVDTYGKGSTKTMYTIYNMYQELTRDPNKVVRESKTTYLYTNGSKKIGIYYFNKNGKPMYYVADWYSVIGLALAHMELLYINEVVQWAYAYYSALGTKGPDDPNNTFYSLDKNTGKMEKVNRVDFNDWGQFKPDYTPPDLIVDVVRKIAFAYQILNTGKYHETVPDDTYKNGTRETEASVKDHYDAEHIDYYDENGVLRKHIYREYWDDDYTYEEVDYFDCNGNHQYSSEEWYDDYWGYTTDISEVFFKNGVPVSGYYDYQSEVSGRWIREDFNPVSKEFVWIDNPLTRLIILPDMLTPFKADLSTCGEKKKKPMIYLGPSLIREDGGGGGNGFNLYGGEAGLTIPLSGKLGLNADLGYYFRNDNGQKLSKAVPMAGATLYPFKGVGYNDKLSVSIHAYGGVTFYTSKYMSYKYTSTDFTLDAGLGLDVNGSGKGLIKGAVLRGGYMPVLADGYTSKNFRVGLGVKF